MKKTLVIFAHPYFEYSTTNVALIKAYGNSEQLVFRDLYEEYPDFHIATFRERKRIREFERLIFHFPLIWFGLPPLIQLWIDEVFDMSWKAESNHPLMNKDAIIIVTMGASEESYHREGLYKTTIEELMKPLILSLSVTGIEIKEIISIYNADDLEEQELADMTEKIKQSLTRYE
ncbi:glutathione-regulated potassium-efflux system ancillary protein KefG [Kaistella treverensis]|uniref:Glutathione-regulated potassium-efflux system ancillary protein KefG n=1 Tax=Kaistella treverensis TaxID=631455 RepID=A0A1I3ND78_9FLAO|nr:NAD(P)H-dependent oxidoreductase [Kaistella treverensis]SFJ07122.1 glutathione-regulated potassium-efflux system ancillary protein KefG [Kaistella treverensis]